MKVDMGFQLCSVLVFWCQLETETFVPVVYDAFLPPHPTYPRTHAHTHTSTTPLLPPHCAARAWGFHPVSLS
ncbi:hypothetical protein EV426DRAFT_615482 [Tirmania nivea]|nr:hypothetical protein EV426DRAFT_615482 [Tirmania nivea]